MTDKACDECANPLMRTPRNQQPVQVICVVCGTQVEAGSSSIPAPAAPSRRSSMSNASQSISEAEVSTPATDLSIEEPPLPELPPFDNEEILARRAQSDQASAEIGQRMLQGWTMLADECPRSTCYGIPLVRPPRSSDGTISKGKECVVCRTDYNPDIERNLPQPPQAAATSPTISPHDGKAERRDANSSTLSNRECSSLHNTQEAMSRETLAKVLPPAPGASVSTSDVLGPCSQAISTTIGSLTTRLTELNSRRTVPYQEVKAVAETISALADALQKVQNASMVF